MSSCKYRQLPIKYDSSKFFRGVFFEMKNLLTFLLFYGKLHLFFNPRALKMADISYQELVITCEACQTVKKFPVEDYDACLRIFKEYHCSNGWTPLNY